MCLTCYVKEARYVSVNISKAIQQMPDIGTRRYFIFRSVFKMFFSQELNSRN